MRAARGIGPTLSRNAAGWNCGEICSCGVAHWTRTLGSPTWIGNSRPIEQCKEKLERAPRKIPDKSQADEVESDSTLKKASSPRADSGGRGGRIRPPAPGRPSTKRHAFVSVPRRWCFFSTGKGHLVHCLVNSSQPA